MKRINAKGRRILIVPDLHIPFHHPSSFQFLEEVKFKYLKEYKKGKEPIILNLGDEIDFHTISMHSLKSSPDPDLPYSPGSELEKAISYIQHLQEIFPKKYLCESNHGSLVYRRAKHHGIPLHVFKTYQEILGTPKWEWHEDFVLETNLGEIYICHGKTSVNGKLSKEQGCSSIQGHYHGKFQIIWNKTVIKDTFDAFSGCLIDRDSLAFAYGKNHIPKPILGCLLISKMGYPRLIKMITNNRNKWIQELP